MPANVDFAGFNFQVPTAGSVTDPAAMTALPLVRSAARKALVRILFTNGLLWLLFRLLVVLLSHPTTALAHALGVSRASAAMTARILSILIRALITFSPACLRGLCTLFHQLQGARSMS